MAEKKPAPKAEPIPQEIQNKMMDMKQEKRQKAMEEDIYGPNATPIMPPKKMAKGGSASARADGCCVRGKTRA